MNQQLEKEPPALVSRLHMQKRIWAAGFMDLLAQRRLDLMCEHVLSSGTFYTLRDRHPTIHEGIASPPPFYNNVNNKV